MKKALATMFILAAVSACTSSSGSGGTGGTSGGSDAAVSGDSATAADTATAGSDTGAATTDTATSGADTASAADTGSSDTATGGNDTAVAADVAPADTTVAAGGAWKDAEPAMKAKCATCHNANAKLFFQAGDCASAASKSSSIKSQIETGKMPQKGMPALEAAEKKAILDWVAAGAKCP